MHAMKTMNWLGAAALLAALAACQPSRTPEEIVAERAQQRWDRVVASDFEGEYDFRPPGYRQSTSRINHVVRMSRRRISWLDARVQSVSCEAERCEAEVLVHYRADGAPGVLSGMENTRPVREIWIQVDGQWWYSGPA